MKTAIIILTYNAERYLEECLDSVIKFSSVSELSLRGASKASDAAISGDSSSKVVGDCFASLATTSLEQKILVVDNASTDRTREIARSYPVEIIVNPENYGFGKGNNIGIKKALEWGADYIVLLNQDLIVSENWLEPLLETMERDKKIAACQPLIMLKEEPDKINAAGNEIHFSGFGYVSQLGKTLDSFQSRPSQSAIRQSKAKSNGQGGGSDTGYLDVPYTMGSCWILRVSAIKEVGLFDEAVLMYHDDMDLCLRLRLKGYQLVLIPKVKVYHYFKDKMTSFSYYWLEINRLWVPLKFFKILTLIVLAPANLVFEMFLFSYSIFKGFGKEWLKARFFTLKNLPHLLAERNKIQKTRLISDRELSRWLTGHLSEVRGAKLENIIRRFLSLFFDSYWRLARLLIFW